MPVRNDFAPGEFCWIDLNAHDLESAAAWYAKVFGWSHMLMETPGGGPPYAFLCQGEDVVGGLGQMDDEMKAQGVPPMWNSYISTDDCAKTEELVKELGGTVTVPTMDVPGHGRLAFFSDPEGACFAAWQATNPESPGMLVADPVSLSWNELMTREKGKARDFYGKVAGWDFSDAPMPDVDYTMLSCDGKDAGGMMVMDGPQFEGMPAHWLVYFAVADCQATADAAAAAGGTVAMPPTKIPVGEFALIADAQGAMFGVITLADAPPC